ncbi:MAG: hypothetical protein ACYC6Y_08160, partial [Thermoguttaceae bacterium]
MNCRQCREILDNLLVDPVGETTEAELRAHLDQCPECARQFAAAEQALASLTPTRRFRASPELREHIMNAISNATFENLQPAADRAADRWLLRWAAALLATAAVLMAAVYLFRPAPGPVPAPGPGPAGRASAFELFASACAAEELVFAGQDVIHLENEILVVPTDDPTWAKMRWLPLISLEASGKTRFHQLSLPAEVGKGYSIKDESWYEAKTGRFARVLTADGNPLFANAFDGRAVYRLETSADASARIVRQEIAKDFKAPASPAEYLGIAAGVRTSADQENQPLVSDAGETRLDDGSKARVLKASFPGPEGVAATIDATWLFTIGELDKTIAKMEFVVGGKPLLAVRRVRLESVKTAGVPWDLAGVEARGGKSESQSPVKILPDMVLTNVTVEHMVEKADFETYVFSKDPAWAGPRQIMDILDLVSPPKRMFAIAHKAGDGRHVVLIQAPSYNRMLGPMADKMGKVVYTSPGGIKVLSSPQDKWLAGILLQSAQAAIGPASSKEQ